MGFRPFVHGLAHRLGLGGFVQNRFGDVLIEVEGEPRTCDDCLRELFDPEDDISILVARFES